MTSDAGAVIPTTSDSPTIEEWREWDLELVEGHDGHALEEARAAEIERVYPGALSDLLGKKLRAWVRR